MTSQYLSRLSELLLEARPRLRTTHTLEFKNCFGAVAGYVRGSIFISCGSFGIALKLPPDAIEQMIRVDGAKHLKYFARGHLKKDYVVLPRSVIEDKSRFRALLDTSIHFVLKRRAPYSMAGINVRERNVGRWERKTPRSCLRNFRSTHRPNCQFVFPSPTGNREQHMLDRGEAVTKRAGLDPSKFDLKTLSFRLCDAHALYTRILPPPPRWPSQASRGRSNSARIVLRVFLLSFYKH